VDTWVEIDGVEMDVLVHYRISPAEPDVNWAGDLEIQGVYYEDHGNIEDQIEDKEFNELVERVSNLLTQAGDPADDYADHLYDLRKDREAEG
jgi:hypothetical protein